MSWSMIDYGEYWAHAHDADQILFMTLAPEFLDSSPEFSAIPWLQEWKAYWLEHKTAHANGCSDIDLQTHLQDQQRVEIFRKFLRTYRSWLSQFGETIPAEVMNAKTAVPNYLRFTAPCRSGDLVDFATTVEDVLIGNTENKSVRRARARDA